MSLPPLIGVIHLLPLPGSPRYGGSLTAIVERAVSDARVLAEAGFDGTLLENYGDAPFTRGDVEPAVVAAMTRCALAVGLAAPELTLGVNVLRNDAQAALAVAAATSATMVRINVHTGARITDQGIIEGGAYHTLRTREQLGLSGRVRLLCDVAVKHSAALAVRPLAEEAADTTERGLADAILLTGPATGMPVDDGELKLLTNTLETPIYVASGATVDNVTKLMSRAHGIIVGSVLRASGQAGDPIDTEAASRFADAFRG